MQLGDGIISGTGSTCTSFFPTLTPPFSSSSSSSHHHRNLSFFSTSTPTPKLPSSSFKLEATPPHQTQTQTQTQTQMSFYQLLGIPDTVTLPEIKRAYKQLARKYHPDVSPPHLVHEYTDRFIRVQEAYETLSDPRRRAVYDRDLARGLHLAFSARIRNNNSHSFEQEIEDKSNWKSRWQEQLSELKRRSTYKDAGRNMSWGARMRRQRNDSSPDS